MDKWVLLFFSCMAIYATVEAVLWFLFMQKEPPQKIEKTIGYSGFGKSMKDRVSISNYYKHGPDGLSTVLIFMLATSFGLLVATYRAFFP